MKKIILEERLPNKSAILTGRPYGEAARRYFKIDEKDEDQNNYLVVINEKTIKAIAPSFLLGLFSKALNNLGKKIL